MMPLRYYLKTFGLAFLIGFVIAFALAGYNWWEDYQRQPPPVRPLAGNVSVSEQLRPQHLARLSEKFAVIVDLRPDGEAFNQASSQEMAQAAQKLGLAFHYFPVPHGDTVPEAAVTELSQLLQQTSKPVLLYCRSGRRAVRTWSLAEASRPNGLDLSAIRHSATQAGQAIDDLDAQLTQRIAARGQQ